MPGGSRSYNRLTGRLANKIQLDFDTFKLPYKLNYLNFYFVNIIAMLLMILEGFSEVAIAYVTISAKTLHVSIFYIVSYK